MSYSTQADWWDSPAHAQSGEWEAHKKVVRAPVGQKKGRTLGDA